MNNETKKAASGWDRVENGQAQPEYVELWDAINEVVAASGGSTSCTNVARQKAVVRVHQAVTAIVASWLARATAPHRGDICMVRVPEPEGGMEECSQTLPCPRHGMRTATAAEPARPVTDEEIEAAIVAASDANFAVGEWDGDTADEPFDAVTQVADAANQELRNLFGRLRGEVADANAERDRMREAVVAIKALKAERGDRTDITFDGDLVTILLGTMVEWFEQSGGKNYVESRCVAKGTEYVFTMQKAVAMTPAEKAVAAEERAEKAEARVAELEAQRLPPGSLLRVDHDLMALARHPGSNLYHVKDTDRPMFVLADSWGEAFAAYEAMVRSENDMEPGEEVEVLGIDFVADRRDILVAPIDVEAKR